MLPSFSQAFATVPIGVLLFSDSKPPSIASEESSIYFPELDLDLVLLHPLARIQSNPKLKWLGLSVHGANQLIERSRKNEFE